MLVYINYIIIMYSNNSLNNESDPGIYRNPQGNIILRVTFPCGSMYMTNEEPNAFIGEYFL